MRLFQKEKTTLVLEELESLAKKDEAQFKKVEGDWKQQIEELHIMVKRVGDWQKPIFKKFGKPGYFASWMPFWASNLKAGSVLPMLPTMKDARYSGATLLQGQEVKTTASETNVFYKASLFVDENWFLTQMLPQTVRLSCPEYILHNLRIAIPKGELVKESLHLLSEKLNK